MLHFEVVVDDLTVAVDHAVDHAFGCGAREVPRRPSDRDPDRIRVPLDPAGHPFCLFAAGE